MTIKTLNRREILGMAGAGLTLFGPRAARAAAGVLADWATPDFVVLNAPCILSPSPMHALKLPIARSSPTIWCVGSRPLAVPALFTSYAYYNPDKFHFYGEELMKRCMAYRTLLDAGVPAAAGSDFDPGPFSPLMGIQGMVTRTGWNGEVWGANQRITVDEALRVNTLNGAYATREESIKGSIVRGKLADFVMLAEDPHTVDPSKIKDIKIVRTVVGGLTQFSA
jgi:imidazolonepropionase-like amidohydrolase